MSQKPSSGVLASLRGSKGLAPALSRCLSRYSTGTVAGRKGDSPFYWLRPCRAGFNIILWIRRPSCKKAKNGLVNRWDLC